MTSAEFRALRLAQGLSIKYMARALDVTERTIRHWEQRDEQPPADAAELVSRLHATQQGMVDNAVAAAVGAPEARQVAMLAYRCTGDLYDAHPALAQDLLPPSWHTVALRQIATALEKRGLSVRIVYFNEESFEAFRDSVPARQATHAAYAAWLASQIDDTPPPPRPEPTFAD